MLLNEEPVGVYRYVYFKTRLGWIGIVATEQGISSLTLPQKESRMVIRQLKKQIPAKTRILFDAYYFGELINNFKQYFRGKEVNFDFPVDLSYGNAFEKKVWEITRSVSYGQIRTYRWIAKELGYPEAIKPVSNALRNNPLPIIIPCHRIVEGNYDQEGYYGGYNWKKRLIKIERK